MRCRSTLCSLLAVSSLVALPCMAGEKLRVCYDDWPPYAAYTPAQGHHGLTLSLMRQIFGELHIEISFQSATQSRCLQAAQAGQVDLMLFGDQQLLPEWGRSQTPTEFWLLTAWVPQDSPLHQYTDIQQFQGLRVGMVRDYVYPEPIASYNDWLPIWQNDAINNLRQLSAKRLDVFFEDLFWTRRMRQQKHLAVRMLRPVVAVQPQYHLYRPAWALAMTHFEQAVQAQIESGEMDRRYRSTLGISYDAIRRRELGLILQGEQD